MPLLAPLKGARMTLQHRAIFCEGRNAKSASAHPRRRASTESIARKPPKPDQTDTKTFSRVRAPVLDHDRVSQGLRERGPRAGPPPPRHCVTRAQGARRPVHARAAARLVAAGSFAQHGYSAKVRSDGGGGGRSREEGWCETTDARESRLRPNSGS